MGCYPKSKQPKKKDTGCAGEVSRQQKRLFSLKGSAVISWPETPFFARANIEISDHGLGTNKTACEIVE